MYKTRLFLGISVVSLLLMGIAVFNPLLGNSSAESEAASDFHQRHPDWIWTVNHQNVVIPVTGEEAFPDYHQRHPELSARAESLIDLTDYYFRHLNN
jgi:hypothetical protein